MQNQLRLVHDLVTPLTMVKLNCEQLKNKISNKKFSTYISRIDQGINDMAELLNSKTQIARPTIYRTTINNEIKKILKLYQLTFQQHKILVKLDLQEDFLLDNNYLAFKRIINNLLSNAREALIGMMLQKRIVIRTKHSEEGFILSIADNGKGIPIDIQNRIFDYGFTTKNNDLVSTRKIHGIGLFTVRELLLREFNAFITCNSQVGVGTCFDILFLQH